MIEQIIFFILGLLTGLIWDYFKRKKEMKKMSRERLKRFWFWLSWFIFLTYWGFSSLVISCLLSFAEFLLYMLASGTALCGIAYFSGSEKVRYRSFSHSREDVEQK